MSYSPSRKLNSLIRIVSIATLFVEMQMTLLLSLGLSSSFSFSHSTGRLFRSVSRRRTVKTLWLSSSLSSSSSSSPFSSFTDKDGESTTSTPTGILQADTISDLQSQLISSTKSTTIKRMKGLLKSRKKRMAAGLAVVEGPRSIFDLLKRPSTANLVQQVLIQETMWDQYVLALKQHNDWLPLLTPVTAQVLESLTDTVTPQGILATVKIPDYHCHLEQQQQQQQQDQQSIHQPSHDDAPLYIVLDGISDPGNLGTILRSAVAVGVRAILLLPGTTDPFAPKAIRSAMGTCFQIPLIECQDWDEAFQYWLQEKFACPSKRIFAATMEQDVPGMPYYDIQWYETTTSAPTSFLLPSAVIIGQEGQGLSSVVRGAVLQQQIASLHVPMIPNSVESLNAAVCASVVMFEYARQKQQHQQQRFLQGRESDKA